MFSTASALLHRVASPTIPSTSIKIFRDVPALRQWRRKQLIDYRTVGLVPTMGALHEGHLSLIRLAAAENSNVIVSIYVNPTQFGVHEDLDSYPKTWEKDCKMLKDLDMELADNGNMGKIAAVFAPTSDTMYPSGPPSQEVKAKGSFVTITPVGELLEGPAGQHFQGVATVCMKLFNIVMPEKDFCMDTKVVIGDTQREHDGLALSSRNVYLGKRRRNIATALFKVLKVAEQGYKFGHRSRDELLGPALELAKLLLMEQYQLKPEERVRFEVDYISLADPMTMEEIQEVDETKGAILSGAIKMLPVEAPQPGEDLGLSDGPPVRLIDNIILKPVKL
ncbi:1dc7f252-2904-437e-a26e-6e6f4ea22ab7 [Sclerotinia trifoliorum]|uniref:Pantoate--beta-alanine ligase n=1 Tax=Sclerotinia trifoliorum TaxID=28548 RepID=A0A8H2W150_9HELO|nr:1dc7f252-2904-437e-a26e-6e6f4ea22ab7 [Sclerotinia trifoliorum]